MMSSWVLLIALWTDGRVETYAWERADQMACKTQAEQKRQEIEAVGRRIIVIGCFQVGSGI